MYNPQAQLELYQKQLDTLRASYNQPLQTSPNININGITVNDIQQMVQQEISKYIPTVKPLEPEKPLSDYEKLMKNINDLASATLSDEHQKFLMNDEILRCVPVFLKSVKGKEALGLLMNEFQSYINGQ